VLGVWLAHMIFALPLLEVSHTLRPGAALWLSEFVATFGLLLTIVGTERLAHGVLASSVGLYIAGAYWFTASTSFANPAVTLARSLTDSFAGIAPASIAGFIAAQLAATITAAIILPWLFPSAGKP
jgi:glycerol uptake facilitator-like aquaporin